MYYTYPNHGSCPNCGYCPHCGRSNQPRNPYFSGQWQQSIGGIDGGLSGDNGKAGINAPQYRAALDKLQKDSGSK